MVAPFSAADSRCGACMFATGRVTRSLLLIVSLIAAAAINAVLFRKILYAMSNYALLLPIVVSFGYQILWPYFWLRWLFRVLCGSDGAQSCGVAQDPEAPATPFQVHPSSGSMNKYMYAIMALLDGVAMLLAVLGGVNTTGPMQILLAKTDLVAVMIFSWIVTRFTGLMHSRFRVSHFVGVGVLLSGIIVVIVPELFARRRGEDTENSLSGIVLFALSVIPASMSAVYKEIVVKPFGADPLYVNVVVASYQFVIACIFLPLLSALGLVHDGVWPLIRDGTHCLIAGTNTAPEDECGSALYIGVFALVVNIFLNWMGLEVTKYGSAMLFLVSVTVALPIASILFMWSAVMGDHASHFRIAYWVGLVLVLVGFVIYRWYQDHETASEPQPHITSISEDLPQLNVLGRKQNSVVDIQSELGTDMILDSPRELELPKERRD